MQTRAGFPLSFNACSCNLGVVPSKDGTEALCPGCGTVKGAAQSKVVLSPDGRACNLSAMPPVVDSVTASRVFGALEAADKRGEPMHAGDALRRLALRSL